MLGYPPFMVEGYCRDLAKEVASSEKEEEMTRASTAYHAHFASTGESPPQEMAYGNFPDILDEVMEVSTTSLYL